MHSAQHNFFYVLDNSIFSCLEVFQHEIHLDLSIGFLFIPYSTCITITVNETPLDFLMARRI